MTSHLVQDAAWQSYLRSTQISLGVTAAGGTGRFEQAVITAIVL